jgi:glycosyltransferase involved in cell wall biosynthesis
MKQAVADIIKITIIVPVYNVEKYVERCLKSITRQMDDEIELIIIDDGSTDDSYEICKTCIPQNLNIKLLRQQNCGLSETRNRGLQMANGDYIMFVDSDDELEGSSLAVLKKNIQEKPKVDVFYFDAEVVDEIADGVKRNNYDRAKKIPNNVIMDNITYFKNYYVDTMIVSACLCLIKKEVLISNQILFDAGRLYEDNYFSFKALLSSSYVCYLQDHLYVRRYRENSITTKSVSSKNIEDMVFVVRRYLGERERVLRKKDFPLVNAYLTLIFRSYLSCEYMALREERQSECVGNLANEIYDMLKHLPVTYRGLSYYLIVEQIMKRKSRDLEDIYTEDDRTALMRQEYLAIFEKIRTYRNKKIGIYGKGKHTDIFLWEYEHFMNEKLQNFVYIDSYADDSVDEQGKEIINISNLESKVDMILISSYCYRLEMLEMCRKYAPNVPVFDFYATEKMNLFDEYIV